MKKPELLAPGGSFLSAYYALEAGADAVYIGLKDFSARKAAQNFSLEQLRRIRRLAADRGRRIYVTLNTIVRESEMSRLRETLSLLEALSVDGVIVQDLGVCELVRRDFPRLAIHASTQMAVHGDAGLRMAEDLGIRRVILSRELPLERIRELRDGHPGIELEVFIHGALCYSFSGICLASWALTGRSANRGECAQICRSAFGDESGVATREGAGGGRGLSDSAAAGGLPEGGAHPFSCRDLFLGREVLMLAEAGVDGLKIEGRMKSPEYVFNVTRLYRSILDRGAELPEDEYQELVRRAEIGFAREKTTGWLHASAGARLIQQGFPGHRGARLGTVASVRGRDVRIRIEADISLHDGLGYFPEASSPPAQFSVLQLKRAGREIKFARAGETVDVRVPDDVAVPPKGAEIRHLSSRFLDLPQPREASFSLARVPLEMEITLAPGGAMSVLAAGFPVFERALTVDAAQRRKPFVQILAALLAESGESLFTAGRILFHNESGLADDSIFVPPSELKRAKNELYAFLEASFPAAASTAEAGPGEPPVIPAGEGGVALSPVDCRSLAQRQLLSPDPDIPYVGGVPEELLLESLRLSAGFRWLPLPPVMRDDKPWAGALRKLLRASPEARFAIGLNNVGHLAIAAELETEPNAFFFVDISLYVANLQALSLLRLRVPRLLFAYSWIEGGTETRDALAAGAASFAVVQPSPDFRPPLFHSLGCYARHVLNNGKCYDDCPQDFSRVLRQGSSSFRLVVRDCVTYLFAASATDRKRGV